MKLVGFTNLIQIRLIEKIYQMDRRDEKFDDVVLDYCQSSMNIEIRGMINANIESIKELLKKYKLDINNEEMDNILFELRFIDDKRIPRIAIRKKNS